MVLFTANSDDRDNTVGDTPSNFSINCDRFRGVKEPNRDGCQITVQSLAMADTLYNINNSNNTIVYTCNAGVRTVVITNGRYTVSQYAAEVAAVITADLVAAIGAGNSLAVSYSSIALKYTFTPTLTAGTFQFNPVSQSGFNAHRPLGYRAFDAADPTAVATTVATQAPYAVNLGYDTIYLWCDIPGINSYSTHRKGWGNLLAILHPEGDPTPGNLLIWRAEWHNGFRIKDVWTKVRFELRDHEDNFIDLNGSDVNITLNITGLKDGLPKAGYFRPAQEMTDLFTLPPPWYEKPYLPSVYNNPKRPAGNNGLVLDPGFMAGGQADRQAPRPRKIGYGFSSEAKRQRR
jgi:hypothetical protein